MDDETLDQRTYDYNTMLEELKEKFGNADIFLQSNNGSNKRLRDYMYGSLCYR